jgi:hypothetical protein
VVFGRLKDALTGARSTRAPEISASDGAAEKRGTSEGGRTLGTVRFTLIGGVSSTAAAAREATHESKGAIHSARRT